MSHETTVHEFRFPDIGEGLTEGTIVELRVSAGQSVRQGDALAVVETDKVVTEIPSPFDGIIVELPIGPGKVVHVGEIVALIRAAVAAPVHAERDAGSVVGKLDTSADGLLPPSTEGILPPEPVSVDAPCVRASPLARKVAAQAGIDLSQVRGTGPAGRILQRDLKAPEAAGNGSRQRLSTTRMAIALAMEKSQTIPAAAVHDWTIVDELLKLRRAINEGLKGKIGLLAFFVKAAAASLVKFPLLSSIYFPEKREYETHETPHVGVAVDTDEGLVVPVIRDAGSMTLEGIQSELERLTARAKARKLTLDEIRGGTFTISNFGSFAGAFGNPMILPPQVAILGVGRIHEQPVVQEGAIRPASVLPLSLVVDHRLIDGAYACKFLAWFMDLVSRPAQLVTA